MSAPGAAAVLALWLVAADGAPGAIPPTLLPSTPPPSSGAGASPAPPPPASAPPASGAATLGSYTLRREGDRHVYRDGRFVARVAPDGSVRFDDVHGKVGILLPLPLPLPHGTSTLEGAVRNMLGQRRRRQGPPPFELWTLPPQDVTAERPSSREVCSYRTPCFFEQVGFVRVAGTFDLTDELMRLVGESPYSRDKARFLAATAGFRAHLGAEYRRATLRQALHRLPQVLAEVWADRGRTAAERRRILYLLWADLDPATDGGRQAAATIQEFIRERLPAGGADAYTAAELEAYGTPGPDRRRFAPYSN